MISAFSFEECNKYLAARIIRTRKTTIYKFEVVRLAERAGR